MRSIIISALLLVAGTVFSVAAEEVVYYVVPIETATADSGKTPTPASPSKTVGLDIKTAQIYPLLKVNAAKKILYWLEPMERKIKSYSFKKDSMGMDYLAVTVDEASKVLVFYVSPMDPKVRSLKPAKDSMGMDYLPAYQARLILK